MAMIAPFGSKCSKKNTSQITWTIGTARRHLQKAHDFLAKKGKIALGKAGTINADKDWGANVKREPVLCRTNKLVLVKNQKCEHNLAEVVNMCATVERLIDSLKWAESEFKGWVVESCHPTQTSGGNDLVLVNLKNRKRACFEVSDVSGPRDGNRKEIKDLVGLKVLKRQEKRPNVKCTNGWRKGSRLFLAVSTEFAERLLPQPPKPPVGIRTLWLAGTPTHCHYDQIECTSKTTAILEVKSGKGTLDASIA
jgi:hypothetical protein